MTLGFCGEKRGIMEKETEEKEFDNSMFTFYHWDVNLTEGTMKG